MRYRCHMSWHASLALRAWLFLVRDSLMTGCLSLSLSLSLSLYIYRGKFERIQLDSTIKVQFYTMCHKLFIFRQNFIFQFWSQMWDHIINIHQSELLYTKIKELRINEHNFFFKWTIYIFYLIIFLYDFLKNLKKL